MILGKRGSGKTTLSRKIQKHSAFQRLIIFDRLGEYSDEKGENVKICETVPDFGAALKEFLKKPKFTLIFQFDIEATNHDEDFNQLMRALYYLGNFCIVIDEVHNFASTHFLPQWLREVLLTGRHRKLALIGTSQRPAEVHKTLLSQCHHIFAGTLHEKNDVDYLSKVMGPEAERLSKLKPYHFLHFRPGFPAKIVKN